MLEAKIASSREAAVRAKALLDVMASENQDEQSVKQLQELGNVFVMVAWDPDTDIYEQAVASGQLLLIDDTSSRFELAAYHSVLDTVLIIPTTFVTNTTFSWNRFWQRTLSIRTLRIQCG